MLSPKRPLHLEQILLKSRSDPRYGLRARRLRWCASRLHGQEGDAALTRHGCGRIDPIERHSHRHGPLSRSQFDDFDDVSVDATRR